MSLRVAIVGGGLQGAGIALELSLRGASVDLFEKRETCLAAASLQNEGKIHLGFIYAKDATLSTARLMIQGALHFERIVSGWLETALPARLVSSPFFYLVHRDSLIREDSVEAYYRTVSALICEAGRQGGSYFGCDASAPARKLSARERDDIACADSIAAAFETPERAIDPEPLAGLLRERIANDPRINVYTGTIVTGVRHDSDYAEVIASGRQGELRERYDHVVNASWENLLAIDATAGIAPVDDWSFRVKYFLRLRESARRLEVPSASIVLGGFGDVVKYGTGDVFLSWYPVGRRGLSSEITPPEWPLPLREPAASEVREGIYEGLVRILPRLKCLAPQAAESDVLGGVIYALGATDVNDPSSRLHERYCVGPRSFGRYHTVDTGKYALAPWFAQITAERIAPRT